MLEPTGGLTAPAAPERGLSSARPARSLPRRQTNRGRKIERAVATQQRARSARPTNGSVDPGYNRTPQRPQPAAPAIGQAVQPDLGAQLSRRVSSGAIPQAQAEQVAKDRALLEQVYGKNWRVKVFGGTGRVRRLRQDIASDEPGNSKEVLQTLLAKRKRLLGSAREQVAAE